MAILLPDPPTPPDDRDTLPVATLVPDLLRSLEATPNAVLVAPPGAGKTTLVPLALLEHASWRGDGTILVLEPRRLAARAAATRMATLLGEPVGARIGYRTRIDAAISAATRVEVVTEGLLVARLLGEPTLDGIAAVLFDEIHERSLDSDLALAFALDLQRTRPELRLLAMSATADAAALAALLGDAPVFRSDGRAFPVVVKHAKRDLVAIRDLPEAVARAARLALSANEGDILAFLPGKGEIDRAAASLADCGARVLKLHGDLPPAVQDEALRPGRDGERRIVLATTIAETSLTVPGVRTVIDGGSRRAPALDPSTGLPRLRTVRVSRAGADQRAGRAGRVAPGTCYRLWTETAHRALAPFDRPEIAEAELAFFALALASWARDWGTDAAALRFADPPAAGALAAGRGLLRDLGALDEAGAITEAGRAMRRLGTHPRLAATMLAAATPGEAARAASLAALLEERDPLSRTHAASADIALRLDAIEHGVVPDGADRGAIARIRDGARQFRRRLRVRDDVEPEGDPAALLAAGFPDRVGAARGEAGQFRLSGGGGASLAATDPLARSALLVAPALHVGRGTTITLASPLDPERLPAALLARTVEVEERGVDERTGAVFARRRRRLGALVLSDRMLPVDGVALAEALAATAATRLATLLDWTTDARNWQARAALARAHGIGPADLPPIDDAALAGTITPLLAEAIRSAGATRLADLARAIDVAALLRARLGRDGVAQLDRALPQAVALPGGRAAIDYGAPTPTASARAQAFYGLDRHPLVADGRVKLAVALLSPAGRPIAVTGDLHAFWRTGWADARRDMRGRYPRQDWPEEPWREPSRPRHVPRG